MYAYIYIYIYIYVCVCVCVCVCVRACAHICVYECYTQQQWTTYACGRPGSYLARVLSPFKNKLYPECLPHR
uniref:Uncharacterized protein n=1 Tax=Octopus bimaculoides TaxID=37653 RepID=A0A0L8GL72_OCTBM